MKITEFADVICTELILRRYPNQNNRWTAMFSHSDTKDNESDSILSGTYGNGNSPEEALSDYANKIAGKILILNALQDNRQTFVCPKKFD